MPDETQEDAAWAGDALYLPLEQALLQGLGINAIDPAEERVTVDARFLAFLIDDLYRRTPFNLSDYRRYPDIDAAIASGRMEDPRRHFLLNGRKEGRLPFIVPFDAAYYAGEDADLLGLLAREGEGALRGHWEVHGRRNGRAPHPMLEAAFARWARIGAEAGLASATLHGAFVQPYLHPLVDGPPMGFRGGLVLDDEPLSRRLRHRRGHAPADSFPPNAEPVHTLAGEYVFGGFAYHHFGHVMAETVHRILPSRARFDCRKIILVEAVDQHHPPGGFADLGNPQRDALRFLGVEPEDVCVLGDNRVVETLHVAQQGAELSTPPAADYLAMLKDYTCARLDELDPAGTFHERIYVSRSTIAQGGLLGEAYMESLLVAEGWHAFHPERLGFAAQLQTYRRATTLLFLSGSSIHGCELFGQGDLGHCLLLPRGHTPSRFFEALLKPRARRFDLLTPATLLGSAVMFRDGRLANFLGISMLNTAAFVMEMRGLGVARLGTFSHAAYADAARADFDRYIAHYRDYEANRNEPVCLAPTAVIRALAATLDSLL